MWDFAIQTLGSSKFNAQEQEQVDGRKKLRKLPEKRLVAYLALLSAGYPNLLGFAMRKTAYSKGNTYPPARINLSVITVPRMVARILGVSADALEYKLTLIV